MFGRAAKHDMWELRDDSSGKGLQVGLSRDDRGEEGRVLAVGPGPGRNV